MAQITAFEEGGVRGFLHRPERASDGLVLTHGAGINCAAPLLVAAARAFSDAGLCVLRCDLPFRQKRPTGPPPRGSGPADRDGLREAVGALRGIVPGRLLLGGHSYGGRQASMLAAEEPGIAEALLLLSYPLHPPQKPDQLRTEHFPELRVRPVFVHGTADAFGTIEELERAVSLIPVSARIFPIDGGGHDLRRGRFDFTAAKDALLGG
jgi:predicted alpha/beta-hydrolase family hydrolase